jgi:hypothetical protein
MFHERKMHQAVGLASKLKVPLIIFFIVILTASTNKHHRRAKDIVWSLSL